MSLNAQKVIDEGLKGILSALLDKAPWDPSFGSSHATPASDFDKAIGACEAVIQSAMLYATKLRRRKNEEFASTKQLPLELLIRVWKEAVPRDKDYYKALGLLRLTASQGTQAVKVSNGRVTEEGVHAITQMVLKCRQQEYAIELAKQENAKLEREAEILGLRASLLTEYKNMMLEKGVSADPDVLKHILLRLV